MFSFGAMEIMVILAVALIVVGPKKLPDLAKTLGKGMRELRKATDELKSNITDNEAYQDLREIKDSFHDTASSLKDDIYREDEEDTAPASPLLEPLTDAEKQIADSPVLPPPPQPELSASAGDEPQSQKPAKEIDSPLAEPERAEGDKKPVKTDD